MDGYAGSRLEATDMPIPKYLDKARKVILKGFGGPDPYEKLVVEVEIRLPDAVKNTSLETKTVMVGQLIKQLAIHLGPLERDRAVEDLLGKARVFLREGEGTEWVNAWFHRDSAGIVADTLLAPVSIDTTPQVPLVPASNEEEGRDSIASTIGPFSTDAHLLQWMVVNSISQDRVLNNDASLVAAPPNRAGLQTAFGNPRHHVSVPKPARQEINAIVHRRTRNAGHLPRPCICGRVHGPTIVVFQPLSRKAIFCYVLFFFLQFVLSYFCSRMSVKI